jgi:hypothetical protein
LAYLRHYVLRLLLWRSGAIPWNYTRFLDIAAEQILLRKVGGGYIFLHRLLLDYFADLETSSDSHVFAEGRQEIVLATWDIRSEKSNLRAIYWSHSVCGREAAEVESENMHVFHTLIPFSAQRRMLCSLFLPLSGND